MAEHAVAEAAGVPHACGGEPDSGGTREPAPAVFPTLVGVNRRRRTALLR